MKPGKSTWHIGRGDGSSTLEMAVYLRRAQRQYGVRKDQSAAAPHCILVGIVPTEAYELLRLDLFASLKRIQMFVRDEGRTRIS